MAQTSRPCDGCGRPIPRTSPTAPIKRYHSDDCRPRCAVPECPKAVKAAVYCSGHYHRLKRYGDPVAPLAFVRGEGGYDAVHHKLRTHRGRASELPCVDCGEPAEEWSYDHLDPDELTNAKIRESQFSRMPIAYSRKLEHYAPRCVSCHRSFDQRHAR